MRFGSLDNRDTTSGVSSSDDSTLGGNSAFRIPDWGELTQRHKGTKKESVITRFGKDGRGKGEGMGEITETQKRGSTEGKGVTDYELRITNCYQEPSSGDSGTLFGAVAMARFAALSTAAAAAR